MYFGSVQVKTWMQHLTSLIHGAMLSNSNFQKLISIDFLFDENWFTGTFEKYWRPTIRVHCSLKGTNEKISPQKLIFNNFLPVVREFTSQILNESSNFEFDAF